MSRKHWLAAYGEKLSTGAKSAVYPHAMKKI
jgi:hypothetical protein